MACIKLCLMLACHPASAKKPLLATQSRRHYLYKPWPLQQLIMVRFVPEISLPRYSFVTISHPAFHSGAASDEVMLSMAQKVVCGHVCKGSWRHLLPACSSLLENTHRHIADVHNTCNFLYTSVSVNMCCYLVISWAWAVIHHSVPL